MRNSAEAWQRGAGLHQAGRLVEAETVFRKILHRDRRHFPSLLSLGNLAFQTGHTEAALDIFKQARAVDPNAMIAHHNIGLACHVLHRYAEAAESYQCAVRLDPNLRTYCNLTETLRSLGDLPQALHFARIAMAFDPGGEQTEDVHNNLLFVMGYGCLESPGEYLAESRRWVARYCPAPLPPVAVDRSPNKRLKVGFVSADFRDHVIAYAIERTIAGMNEVETIAYASQSVEDDMTRRLKGSFAHWCDISRLTDEQAAAKIRQHEVDILVDLGGRTAGARLKLFAVRPVPIQATYLGATATTGLPLDYFITNEALCPTDTPERFSEGLWRLPGCWQSYAPPDAPDVVSPTGPFTFGSFNAMAKIGPETISLWSEVLRAVPDAQLLLKGNGLGEAAAQERLRRDFGDLASRIVFMAPTASHADHLALYGQVDIALDPVPFTGGATTQEALWMGVPVLTLEGKRLVERISSAILQGSGMPQWIARSRQDYIDKAALYACRTNLANLRMQQRGLMAASAYCDGHRMARDLTDAFRSMWHRYISERQAA